MEIPIQTILAAALPVFLLLFLGAFLRRTGVLAVESDGSLMKLVIRVLYPCLILDFILGNPALDHMGNLVAAPLAGFLAVSFGFAVAYLVGRSLGLVRGKGLRTFAYCSGIFNYGFIPIPVILVLFDSREALGVLLVHNMGVELAIWTCGIILLAGRLERSSLKRLLNPPLIALVVALAVNFAGLDSRMPVWLDRFVEMLAACSIPLGILLAGANIADLIRQQGRANPIRVPAGAVAVRLGILPVLMLAGAAWMPGLSTELRQVLVVQAAMPAGIMPIVLARHYGGEAGVGVQVVLATTLCSVVTMPLWIHLGLTLVFG